MQFCEKENPWSKAHGHVCFLSNVYDSYYDFVDNHCASDGEEMMEDAIRDGVILDTKEH